nr:MAG: tRNA endonuclease-like protein [Lokiarchaeota virus Ratatoskr Meg22_1012]
MIWISPDVFLRKIDDANLSEFEEPKRTILELLQKRNQKIIDFLHDLFYVINVYINTNNLEWKNEKDIENWIIDRWIYIPWLKELNFFAQQYRCKYGIIDILAKERKSNNYTIIEIKQQANKNVIGQILKYMTAIKEEKKCDVKGIIISGEKKIDVGLKKSLQFIDGITIRSVFSFTAKCAIQERVIRNLIDLFSSSINIFDKTQTLKQYLKDSKITAEDVLKDFQGEGLWWKDEI